jgi:hypothetical protein
MRLRDEPIEPGWDAYDVEGHKLGMVQEVTDEYLAVDPVAVPIPELYVPPEAIESLDAERERVFLTVRSDDTEVLSWRERPSGEVRRNQRVAQTLQSVHSAVDRTIDETVGPTITTLEAIKSAIDASRDDAELGRYVRAIVEGATTE